MDSHDGSIVYFYAFSTTYTVDLFYFTATWKIKYSRKQENHTKHKSSSYFKNDFDGFLTWFWSRKCHQIVFLQLRDQYVHM